MSDPYLLLDSIAPLRTAFPSGMLVGKCLSSRYTYLHMVAGCLGLAMGCSPKPLFFFFFWKYIRHVPQIDTRKGRHKMARFEDKIAVVTGAGSGMGCEVTS
jgi:hypothetical protein